MKATVILYVMFVAMTSAAEETEKIEKKQGLNWGDHSVYASGWGIPKAIITEPAVKTVVTSPWSSGWSSGLNHWNDDWHNGWNGLNSWNGLNAWRPDKFRCNSLNAHSGWNGVSDGWNNLGWNNQWNAKVVQPIGWSHNAGWSSPYAHGW